MLPEGYAVVTSPANLRRWLDVWRRGSKPGRRARAFMGRIARDCR